LYVVSGSFTTEAERRARQAALNANPPNPGSILVKDKAETWEVIHPKLDTFEASADGLNIKKMIAAGSGTPLHFLAEPESSTRTTAEAAGGPTFRHYQQRQEFFFWMLQTILKAVVARRKMVDNNISLKAETTINGSDISGRDNASLATAATTIHAAFAQLRDKNLIDDAELLRVVYKFAAETVNPQEMIERARANPTSNREDKPDIPTPAPYTPPVKLDPITGEPKDDF
jgi:hypothetical protein